MPPDEQSITSTPLRLDDLRQRDALVRSPAGIVLHREAQEQRLGRGPVRAHAFDHLDREAHAVELAAAIFVVAQIENGERN
jgi:hypothetical protein